MTQSITKKDMQGEEKLKAKIEIEKKGVETI